MLTTLIPSKRMNLLACFLGCGLIVGFFAGCASPNYDRGAKTSAAINSAASQSADFASKVTASVDALTALDYQSQGDLRSHYADFSEKVKNLQTSFKHLSHQITQAQSQANAYLKNWNQTSSQIQSHQIRSISDQQQQDISNKLSSVKQKYQEVKAAYKPFISDLKGIKTYLGSDLTANGLSAIKQVVKKTKGDATPLRQSLQSLQTHLTALGSATSPMLSGGSQ